MAELDLSFVRRFPDECGWGVTRDYEFQPCGKPAVALALDPTDEGMDPRRPYPVCAFHTRKGSSLPLVEWIHHE